jgi:hypothetical protein
VTDPAPPDAIDLSSQGSRPTPEPPGRQRLDFDPDKVQKGLGQLVLTVVALLHELMERQAIRRMEAGSLTDDQVEKLGQTLAALRGEIEKLRDHFGLTGEELNLDLGPLGKLY